MNELVGHIGDLEAKVANLQSQLAEKDRVIGELRDKAALAIELRLAILHASGVDGVFDEAMNFAARYDALQPPTQEASDGV